MVDNWILFSKEYVARGRKKSYIDKHVIPTSLDRFVSGLTGLVYIIGYGPCKLPIINQIIEICVTSWPRGRVGFLLRAIYWKTRLGHMDKDVFIDRGVTIFPEPKNVFIGDGTHIDTNVTIISGGLLIIGKEVHIASNVVLNSKPWMEIGDRACISSNSSVYASTNYYTDGKRRMSFSACSPDDEQFVKQVGFRMGVCSFIGANCCVIPNSELGDYAILGAGNFLNKKIEDYGIFIGKLKPQVSPVDTAINSNKK